MSSAKLGFCRFGWPWWIYLAQHTIPIPRLSKTAHQQYHIGIPTLIKSSLSSLFSAKKLGGNTRKQVVSLQLGGEKGHHAVMIMSLWPINSRIPSKAAVSSLCRLLANDRKVTRWAKTACVSCSGKAGNKVVEVFCGVEEGWPYWQSHLGVIITVKGCERYPKRVVQKHLAQWDAKVDMGNIQWCTCLIYPDWCFSENFQTFCRISSTVFSMGCVIEEQNIRKRVHVGTYTYDLYMMCIYVMHILQEYTEKWTANIISVRQYPTMMTLNKSWKFNIIIAVCHKHMSLWCTCTRL